MGLLLEGYTKFLEDYGYLSSEDAANISRFDDIQLTSAVEKFRKFDANVQRQAMLTGDIVSATEAAMLMPRCACPDDPEGTEAATGSGGWKNCHGIRDGHKAIVRVNFKNQPSFIKPDFKTILRNVQRSYAELGLLLIFVDGDQRDILTGNGEASRANIEMSFTRGSGWIGLAIVGNGGNQRCNSNIWAKFDYRYQPRNIVSEWTTLIKHEIGHNTGLRHSRGGVMNPSLVNGLPVSWKGDPHERTLSGWFGGEPVDIPGGDNDPPKPPTGDDGWPAPFNPIGESFQLAEGVRAQLFRVMGG